MLSQQKLLKAILSYTAIDAIYLYGSRVKQTATEKSDWDIAVLFTHFEKDLVTRSLHPQYLEAHLERELNAYGEVSVVDLEIAPMYLQYSILTSAIKWYDREVSHVRRVEQGIFSKWEKDYARYSV